MAESLLSRVEKQFQEAPHDLDILLMGDSHIQYGLNPLKLAGSFNYSSAGESYIQTYYKLKSLLDHDYKRFKVLVLQCDYHSFSTMYYKEADNVWFWKRYVDYFEIGRIKNQRILYTTKWLRAYFASYFNEQAAVLHFLRGPSKDILILKKGHLFGWPVKGETEELLKVKAGEKAYAHFKVGDVIDRSIVYYFQRILALCREKGIKVVLVRFPVSKYYYDKALEFGVVDKVDNLILAIQQQSPDIKLFDFHLLYDNNMKYFCDVDHLSIEGADTLTEQLRPVLTQYVSEVHY